MEDAIILQELEALAAELSVDLRFEDLQGESSGGLCRLGGRVYLFLDRTLSVPARVQLLVRELADLPLHGVFVRPGVRELLEAHGQSPTAV